MIILFILYKYILNKYLINNQKYKINNLFKIVSFILKTSISYINIWNTINIDDFIYNSQVKKYKTMKI